MVLCKALKKTHLYIYVNIYFSSILEYFLRFFFLGGLAAMWFPTLTSCSKN